MRSIRLCIASVLLLSVQCATVNSQDEQKLQGAWQNGPDENRITWINAGKYFAAAVYNVKENKFLGTCGGTWKVDGGEFVEVHEFNTMHPDWIGKEIRSKIEVEDSKLTITADEKQEIWTRVDDTTPGKLAGAWLITGRINNGELRERTPGARKTMKILSGTRFQWIAYNSETKEFFGTGGGSYTTENGKYAEKIDFFSRDNSRVGKKLEFDYSIEGGRWHHKGLSSKGEPITKCGLRASSLESRRRIEFSVFILQPMLSLPSNLFKSKS